MKFRHQTGLLSQQYWPVELPASPLDDDARGEYRRRTPVTTVADPAVPVEQFGQLRLVGHSQNRCEPFEYR